jgi:mannose-6-phosphate isomerase-like protein (cupin superfamily)
MAATSVKAQVYRVRTPLLKEGRSDVTLAQNEVMEVRVKCYAEGGENALHTHTKEDHTFVILQGQARFFDENGEVGVLGRNDGIFQPAGSFYRFESCGDEPLVLFRVGAIPPGETNDRIDPEGMPLPGQSAENGWRPPVPIEGKFYE